MPFDEHMAALTTEGRWEGELIHTTKDGRQLVVLSRQALQRDEAGHPVAIMEINLDITERKQAEEETKRYASQLELSNRELQDFAFVASHDLQEPLRKIQAFGDRLKSGVRGTPRCRGARLSGPDAKCRPAHAGPDPGPAQLFPGDDEGAALLPVDLAPSRGKRSATWRRV